MPKPKMTVLTMATALLLNAVPVDAASVEDGGAPSAVARAGAFAGARVRLALGGARDIRRERIRAGLTLAPMRQSFSARGRQHVFYGEGFELGFASGKPVAFSLAGQPLSRLPDGRRQGISTLGKVAIGVGVVAVIVVGVTYARVHDALNDPDR